MLLLRYQALKSMELDDEEEARKKLNAKRKKVKIKKHKKHKKQDKVKASLSSSSSMTKYSNRRSTSNSNNNNSRRPNDNYEIQDMEIDSIVGNEAILADKDMRSQHQMMPKKFMSIDEPKTMSFMELMIDYDLSTYSVAKQSPNTSTVISKQDNSFYSNDLYPNKYFEYQKIPIIAANAQKMRKNRKNKMIKKNISNNLSVIERNKERDDDDINQLRDNLLNDLNLKRAQKQQQQQQQQQQVVVEEEINQKKSEDFDLSNYETTIQLARKQIEEANALRQQHQQHQLNLSNKIMPIIIKLGTKDETSSDDDSDLEAQEQEERSPAKAIEQEAALQSNISLFLNAAKEQAKLEIQKQMTTVSIHSQSSAKTQRIVIKNTPPQPPPPPVSTSITNSPSKLSATIKRLKETSRKDEIRIVRDRINIKR